jgi:hypothetical protein
VWFYFDVIEKEVEAERVGEVVDYGEQNWKFPVAIIDTADFWF